jgi:MOSC domain-containing protein
MLVGTVKEIWRYPVKSLGGTAVESAHLHENGIAGDRGWAVIDATTGDICSAKQIAALLHLTARYQIEPPEKLAYRDEVSPVVIIFPDGREFVSPEDQAAAISEFTGRQLTLHSLEPPQNVDHYRRSTPLSNELVRALTDLFGKGDSGFENYDEETRSNLMECFCPPGAYYDVSPLHLLTTATLEHMTKESGELFDCRRFRPNLLVETPANIHGTAEFDWVGKFLRVGEVLLKVKSRTIRCAMPTLEQVHFGLGRNQKIGRALNQITNRFLGVNIDVERSGLIHAGDEIVLLD